MGAEDSKKFWGVGASVLIIPAIDLKDGKCVRLYQGRKEEVTVFSRDPVAVAKGWEEAGAKLLHLVDLDGAFAGVPKNAQVIKQILKEVKIPVQLGGGIRNLETIERLLDQGVSRVILGTSAIMNPRLIEKACALYGERIVLGLDAKDGLVAIKGWEEQAPKTYLELAEEMEGLGVRRVIFTDIKRDGTLQGPNLESTRLLAEKTSLKVIASGGISSLEDIKNLLELEPYGVEGAIVGKALYTGSIRLEEALALAQREAGR